MRVVESLFAVLLLVVLACPAGAETEVTLEGQVRVRGEMDDRSFSPDDELSDVNLLRVRAGIEALIDKNTEIYIQLQDSRVFGGEINGAYSSGTLNNSDNVDLHQGYIAVRRLWHDRLSAKAGRFEFTLGNQRLFGSVGWSNVGRSWEGMTVGWDLTDVTVLPFFLKRQEKLDQQRGTDFEVTGLNVSIPQAAAEVLVVYEDDGGGVFVNAPSEPLQYINNLDRFTVAGFTAQELGAGFVLTANAAYQFGDMRRGDEEIDIAAWLITVEIARSFGSARLKRLALGVDIASGDDPNDDTWQAFNNLYYTGHKFRGFMDYFVASNPEGLLDIYARAAVTLSPGWSLTADLHHFRTPQDFLPFPLEAVAQEATRQLGTELDLTLSTTTVPGLTLTGGLSVFAASDEFAKRTIGAGIGEEPGNDPGIWSYLMATANF